MPEFQHVILLKSELCFYAVLLKSSSISKTRLDFFQSIFILMCVRSVGKCSGSAIVTAAVGSVCESLHVWARQAGSPISENVSGRNTRTCAQRICNSKKLSTVQMPSCKEEVKLWHKNMVDYYVRFAKWSKSQETLNEKELQNQYRVWSHFYL